MPVKTTRPASPRRKKIAVDLTTLWTARALLHTDTLRWFLHAEPEERSPLDAIGLKGVTASTSLTRAREKLRARVAELETHTVSRDAVLFRNVDALGELLALTVAERDVLAFAIILDYHRPLLACFERLEGLSLRRLQTLLAEVLGLSEDAVRDALRRTSPLASTGLVRVASDVRRTWDDPFEVMDGLENILLGEYDAPEAILANFFRESPTARLTLEDFPHARADVDLLRRFLQGALRAGAAGVNVLIYGLPGTGKTELARAVAKTLGGQLYEVNVEAEDGAAIGGNGRFGAYQLCQRMLARRQETLVLFDEIEDVFPDRYFPFFGRQKRSGDDKGWTNRLLEGNAVPTLWLSNEVGQMDAAFLRRFDFILELRTPPQPVRRRILDKELAGLPVRAPWVATMANDERLTPAHIERAARVARLSGLEGPDEVEQAVAKILHNALAVQAPARPASPVESDTYDLRFLNCSEDLTAIVASLEHRALELRGSLTGSICLYGPPGTGKTAFAHHLAQRLGHRLLVKRASDILGPFVGQTEANIAEMFREARAEGAMLLIDEADSFFQDRRGAFHHWEVTQVNELLMQMEAFDGLLICSTNLFENLDQASLRRFTLKIKFEPLRPEQRWELFARTLKSLGHELPADRAPTLRRGLDALENLTPGDFATIRRQAGMLGSAVDAGELLTALQRESRGKPNARRGPLGFAN